MSKYKGDEKVYIAGKLISDMNGPLYIDFGDTPNEEALNFMKKVAQDEFGISDMESLSDEEYLELGYELHVIESWEHSERGDRENRKPLSEYGLMISGMIVYMSNQFQDNGGKRYRKISD